MIQQHVLFVALLLDAISPLRRDKSVLPLLLFLIVSTIKVFFGYCTGRFRTSACRCDLAAAHLHMQGFSCGKASLCHLDSRMHFCMTR